MLVHSFSSRGLRRARFAFGDSPLRRLPLERGSTVSSARQRSAVRFVDDRLELSAASELPCLLSECSVDQRRFE